MGTPAHQAVLACPVRVLIPLPDHDFDVTEVAVPWRLLTNAGHEVTFATEQGDTTPEADPRLLTGVLFGQLGAAEEPKHFYEQLTKSQEFQKPRAWQALTPTDYDGLVLPGGHAPGMRQYLDGEILRTKVAEFWQLNRPVGAICHGVIVLARTTDPTTGKSVLANKRTTSLTKPLERTAYYLTAWRLGSYYRTYPTYVEDEVKAALTSPTQYERGPTNLARGTATDDKPAFVVEDGNYISARWPGDSYLFTKRFIQQLEQQPKNAR